MAGWPRDRRHPAAARDAGPRGRRPAVRRRVAAARRPAAGGARADAGLGALRLLRLGAYDDDGAMVAASAGFFGHPGERVSYHSHITGVLPSAQGRGVGLAVKHHQYAWALEHGVAEIVWTFDPLLARNASFNLARLGADVVSYLPDFYGAMSDGVNAGQGSDRLYVHWDVVPGGPSPREVDTRDAVTMLAAGRRQPAPARRRPTRAGCWSGCRSTSSGCAPSSRTWHGRGGPPSARCWAVCSTTEGASWASRAPDSTWWRGTGDEARRGWSCAGSGCRSRRRSGRPSAPRPSATCCWCGPSPTTPRAGASASR